MNISGKLSRGVAVGGLLLLAVAVFFGLSFFHGISPQSYFSKNDGKSLEILKSFPRFDNSDPIIYPDPYDPQIIWLADKGGLLAYNLKDKKIVQTYLATEGIPNAPWGSLVRKGDEMFIGFQGGFERFNLKTKQFKIFTVADGLVNGSNIAVFADPVEDSILWIGTFDGLSRFDIATETFTNFQSEIGTGGTHWGINEKVWPLPDSVWVVVNANAYSAGGVARYDKQTKTWQAWGPQSLGSGARLDIMSLATHGDRVWATATDAGLWEYSLETGTWRELLSPDVRSFRRTLAYAHDRIYFVQKEKLAYFDLHDSRIHETAIVVPGYLGQIYHDISNDRLILSGGGYEFVIYSSADHETQQVVISRPLDFQMSELLWVDGSSIFFKSTSSLFVYDLSKGTLSLIKGVELKGGVTYFKKLGDTLVVLQGPLCDFECTGGAIFMLKDLALEQVFPLPDDFYAGDMMVGNQLDQIYVLNQSRPGSLVQQFDPQLRRFVTSSVTALDLQNNSSLIGFSTNGSSEKFLTSSPDGDEGAFSLEVQSGKNADAVSFRVREGEGEWREERVTVAPASYNPFGWSSSVSVSDVQFEPEKPHRAWLATDRGLVVYDFKQKVGRVITAEDGLGNSRIARILFIAGQLLLEDGSGIYLIKSPGDEFVKGEEE